MAEVDLPSPTNSEAAAMPSERLKQKVLSLSQQCETLRATLQERDAAAADRLAPQQAELLTRRVAADLLRAEVEELRGKIDAMDGEAREGAAERESPRRESPRRRRACYPDARRSTPRRRPWGAAGAATPTVADKSKGVPHRSGRHRSQPPGGSGAWAGDGDGGFDDHRTPPRHHPGGFDDDLY